MAAIDELSTFAAPEDPYRTTGDNDIGLSDYVRKFAADAYGVPGQLAGAAEYAFRVPSGTDLERIRDWADEGAKAQVQKMSPGAQRNLQATFLPGEGPTIWDKDISTGHALGLRAVGAIPSVLASIVPGAMVARVAGATAGALVGGAAAAGQTAGDTYNQIVGEFRDTPDDELRAKSPAYQGFRNMGMSEREARERLVETVTSYKPALMGAITLVTSKYGVEGLTARRFGGEAAKGSIRGHIAGATAGEFVQEGIENASQELLQQQAGFDLRGVQGEYNWAKILEEAVSGAAIGGIMGGSVGAVTARPGHSGGRRRTRDEILGKPTPELDQKPDETAVPVAVAPTSVSPAQSTDEVLSTVRAKATADGQAIAAEQTNPVKAGEEMPAAIAQKPAETHGGVDLKPGEPTPALTPTTVTVDPDHAVALTAPAAVPQTAQRQHDLISQAEQELIPPIPAHSVTSPEIAAAITHDAPSIVKGMIDAKVSEAATQNAPARPDPAAALSAAAVPTVTGAVEPATTAPVAPATGVAGASTTSTQTLAETPVTSTPSEVIPPAVVEPPVKRKPGPRKNVAAPATPGQSAPDHADTHAAKVKATTDDGVTRIADLIRARETALKSVTDFADGVPIATKAANEITAIMEAAVPVLGKRDAFRLADQARKIVEAEKAGARPASAEGIAAAPALDVDIAPKGRILKDELAVRRERKGPRETAHKKAQRERGETEILGKAEDEARQRRRALDEVAASVRKAFDEVTYDRAEMSTAKAQRDYMKALVKAVELPDEPGKPGKKLSLANLPADAPAELRHLVAAKALSQGAGNETQRFDFMANDLALREGTNLSTEYARTQATKGEAGYDEDVHGARAASETSGRNAAEEEMLDEIDRRRTEAMNARSMNERAMMLKRIASAFEGGELSPQAQKKIDLIRKLAASTTFEGEKQAAAAREAAIRERAGGEGMAKYVTAGKSKEGTFKAEKKARLTPAEIKARAAAIREGLQTKRENALEAGATARTEAEGVAQTEGIIRASFGESENTFEETKGDILSEVGPIARLRARIASGVASMQGKTQVRHHSGRTVFGEHIGSVQDALRQIPLDKLNEGTRNVVEMARNNFDNTPPVYVVSPADLHYLYTGKRWTGQTRFRDIANKIPRGLWSVDRTGREQVLIREDIVSDRNTYASVLTHESAHSEIGLRAQFNPDVAWNIHEIRAEARKAWLAAGKPDVTYLNYGLHGDKERTTNEILMGESPEVDEFLAELVSNWRLQKFLFTASASQELRVTLGLSTPDTITPKFTMWDTIMAYFGKVLGLTKPDISLLDVALRQWEVLNEYEGQPGKLTAAKEAAYFGEETVEAAKDLPKSLPAYLQRWGLTGATVDQITRWTHSLFKNNAMRRFEKALQQMHAASQDADKPGQALAGRWEQLSRDDALEVQKAAEVFNTANIYDLDPSKPMDQDPRLSGNKLKHVQRKAMFPQLREDFLAMKPATRELMEQTSRHFKSLQVAQITQATTNLLQGSNLSPAQIKDITDSTLNGKLTATDPDNPTGQSHQEIINDDGTWRLLKNYFSVLKARGMYFPLMRHGDWVVTTDPKLPENLRGAKVLDDKTTRSTKTLEWRGSESDQKKLRGQYDAFFEENTDPSLVSSRIVRYEPGTNNEISEANSRGHPHDIAYRAVVQTQGVYFHESQAQARRFIKQNPDLNPDSKPLERKNWDRTDGIGAAELSGLMSTIDRRSDMSTQQKELTKSIVKQAAVQLMPGNRMQHRALKRRGVKGADMDLARNTSEYSAAAASVLGKMAHMPEARAALEDMSAQHKENLDNKQDPHNQLRGQIINELMSRVDTHVLDPRSNSRAVQNIMTLTFSAKLLTPSYSVVNGTQPWMVTLPVLGSIYGNMKAGAALWNAYRAIGLRGALIDSVMNTGRAMSPSALKKVVLNLDDPWTDIRKNVAKQKDGALLSQMFKEVIDVRGLVDDASAFELGHGISRGAFTSALGKLDRISRQLPFGIEAINRSVTLVSAFRLAYEVNQNYDAAVQAAIDALQSTQFNYSSYNQPAFFNKPLLRPGLQFKKYGQNIFALMAGAIHDSFKGATKQERKQAQKLLMNFMGVTIAMAGALGLPGVELLRVAFTLSALLGFTDGWEDQERKLRKLLRESIGKTPEELFSKGILSRAAGIDLSSRLGYSDMFTFSEPKTMDAEGMHAYLWRLFAGAPGSVVSDFGSAIGDAGNGEFTKAFIKMVPAKVVADIAKAARGRFDATTKEPLNNAEAVLQAIGFRSARVAEHGEEVGAKVSLQKKLQAKAKELNAAYLSATTKGELAKIKGQILAHNRVVEEAKAGLRQKAYSPKTLDRIRDEKRARREALVGAD